MSSVPVNIEETNHFYILELVTPGLEKNNFPVNVDGDMLRVSFKQNDENKEQNKKWLTQEYRCQQFSKTFTLDKTVNSEKIEANYENGILKIFIPKSKQSKKFPQTIQVQ